MTEEDEAFDTLEKAIGWRKRQTEETIKLRDAFDNAVFDAMDRDHDHKYIKHQLHPMPPTSRIRVRQCPTPRHSAKSSRRCKKCVVRIATPTLS